jgi:hypothetical protein
MEIRGVFFFYIFRYIYGVGCDGMLLKVVNEEVASKDS